MHKVYIIEIKRSPIGKTNGALAHCRPEKLIAELIKDMILLKKIKIQDVLIANTVGLGGNLGRLSVLEAGLPMATPATTIDFQCGGSLKALEYGYYAIASGAKEAVLVGGVESTSLEPRKMMHPSDPKYHGEIAEKRGQFSPENIGDPDMLEGAENCYAYFKPPKNQIDDIVLRSHARAVKTRQEELLKTLITPIMGADGDLVKEDESIRPRMSQRLIDKSVPIVKEGGYTTVTNSCLTHDGASLMLLVSEKTLKASGVTPMLEILGIESVGLNPNYSPLGPVVATKKLLKKHDLKTEDIAALEVNEAFAIKTWAMENVLGFSESVVNPLGGALAYGHPYGASGGILMAHLSVALKDKEKEYGIATMGVAGGQGIAVLVRCPHE